MKKGFCRGRGDETMSVNKSAKYKEKWENVKETCYKGWQFFNVVFLPKWQPLFIFSAKDVNPEFNSLPAKKNSVF